MNQFTAPSLSIVVGVAFHDNSTLTLPITTFDVCASIEGELARDITVTLATSEADGRLTLTFTCVKVYGCIYSMSMFPW